MIPIEKAKELVENFYKFANSTDFDSDHGEFFTNNELWKNNAKQCALICVNEIITLRKREGSIFDYWEKVKQEIEKL